MRAVKMQTLHWALPVIMAALLLLAGCIPDAKRTGTPQSGAGAHPSPAAERLPPEEPTTSAQPSYLVHTVRWNGETLSIIAKWYTGDMSNWLRLTEHNPLDDPNRISIGDRISIPDSLVKTRDPLPRAFVERHTKPPGKTGFPPPPEPQHEPEPGKPAAGPPPEDNAPELFGPKELKGE